MSSAKQIAKNETLKIAILEATKNMVVKEGWQSVSMRKIADAIGYSLPMVYKHFENKDAILEEFVKQGFNKLSEVMAQAKQQYGAASEQLTAMANAYFKFAFQQTAYYQMMFGLGMPSCERMSKVTAINNFTVLVIDTIKQLSSIDKEEIIRLKFHTFWSILHGLTSINMVNMTATPNEIQQSVLQDAIQGFIKNINH
jgi:AcrR family transcriptional regulator